MFDPDKWQEIFATIKKNKLRTFLTAFSVAWGIFMLMVLLGAGNGLSNGVGSNFEGNATNALWIWSRETSIPYKGMQVGRRIYFDMKDYEELKKMKGIDKISARYFSDSRTYAYKSEYGQYTTQGCHPDFMAIEKFDITHGRFINDIDIQYERKVVVIGKEIKDALFKGIDPLGEYLNIGGVLYQIIGVYAESDPREGANQGLIPITTAQLIFNIGDRVHDLALTTVDVSKAESQEIEKEVRAILAANHKVDIDDKRAIGIYNSLEDYIETMNIFSAINMFIWLIGIGTLIAGIVGVSNIMLIVVNERTREIGIRKAIGATPSSIVGLILLESVFITLIAGYIGMLIGISLMELINFVMESQASQAASTDRGQFRMFMNPTVDFRIALSSLLLLVGAGALAGYIPAKRAASIKPIDALHNE
ncbi:MAG: ABC transporter permease [Mangrovibacterium sp.]